ncbi:transmembrane protein 97 [Carica papaya]|uniref:transmembrane protein 97 n=1 Tax=Carica papaya TaxID=3649 RepID=UPI000B8CDC50|nr:transmembrane protein 97 [Carica papaya]
MGALGKLVDAILLLFSLVIALAAPLLDAQTCLPTTIFPDLLVETKQWYSREYGDYLVEEKPNFFVALVWIELLLQWPLSLVNIYGILAGKSWVKSTCLIYGVSTFTSMVTILGELKGSGKASDTLMNMYLPFLGFSILAILRGLVPQSAKSATIIGKRPAIARKKRA